MKKIYLSVFGLLNLLTASQMILAATMTIHSNSLQPNGVMSSKQVFNGFGCSGNNLSPQLSWSSAPKGTKSYAIIVHDPDAPTGGGGWWHWVVTNIPASTTSLSEGAGTPGNPELPVGVTQVTTDFGTAGWGGPCPPKGDKPHHYNITVYALNVEKTDLPANATAALAGYMINQHAIAKATLTGKYGRVGR